MRKVIVLGASPNPARYSYVAVKMLKKWGYDVIPIGIKNGEIEGVIINTDLPEVNDIHTVSIFLSKAKQKQYESYILSLQPARIIFNPGAENPNFQRRAKRKGIEIIKACTIEMISGRKF